MVIADPSWTTDTSPITLTFFFDRMAGSDSNLNEHYGDDELTKIFVEETGVDFDMTFSPDSDQTMLNVLIASGDLPDMMRMHHTLQQATQLVQRGLVHDLDALSRKFAPKYMDNWGKRIRLYYRMHFDDMGFYFHPAYHVNDEQMDSPLLLKAMPGVTVLQGGLRVPRRTGDQQHRRLRRPAAPREAGVPGADARAVGARPLPGQGRQSAARLGLAAAGRPRQALFSRATTACGTSTGSTKTSRRCCSSPTPCTTSSSSPVRSSRRSSRSSGAT